MRTAPDTSLSRTAFDVLSLAHRNFSYPFSCASHFICIIHTYIICIDIYYTLTYTIYTWIDRQAWRVGDNIKSAVHIIIIIIIMIMIIYSETAYLVVWMKVRLPHTRLLVCTVCILTYI